MNRAKKEKERLRKRQARNSFDVTFNQLLTLIGNDDTEITDDVIQALLTLMQAHNTQNLCIGFYTPAEITLMINQPNCIPSRTLPTNTSCVVIHPLEGHWVTSYYNVNIRQLYVYDSLQSNSHYLQVKEQIRLVYGEEIADNFKYVSVTQQNYMPICGVLAFAFAVSIYFGMDPEKINYDISKARDHLRKCLTSGHIEPFPTKVIITPMASDNLLHNYFDDQAQRDREKRNSEQVLSHKSEIPLKQSCNTTYSSDTARKRKSRENVDVRENEKTCDKLYRKTRRKNEQLREYEKEKDRLYRKTRRKYGHIRQNEKENDRTYREMRRKDKQIREKEKEKERTYRETRRKDKQIRESEKEKDTVYTKTRRRDKQIREKEKEKDRTDRGMRRKDKQIREKEKEKERTYRETRRKDKQIRESEKEKDTVYTKTRRRDKQIREKEKEKDRTDRGMRRKDKQIREKEKEKERTYRETRRKDKQIRESEKEKDTVYTKTRRRDKQIREKEKEKERTYRETRRKDKQIREKEKEKDKAYRTTRRKNPSIRDNERKG